MSKVLLTGNNGYVGTVMSRELKLAGHDVYGLDSNLYEHLVFGNLSDSIFTLNKDVRDCVADDLRGFDVVVHLAGLSNDPLGSLKKDWTYSINMNGTLELALIARNVGVKRFIFASSCSMYGPGKSDDVLLNEFDLQLPVTSYAESKVWAEDGLRKLSDDGFCCVFLRFGTMYGASARMRLDLVVNAMTAWAYTTGNIIVYGDGDAWRPVIHLKDASLAVNLVIGANINQVFNESFNVGQDSENYQVRELADMVSSLVPNSTIQYADSKDKDIRSYKVDFSMIRNQLRYNPRWNVEKGIIQLYKFYMDNGLQESDVKDNKYSRIFQLKNVLDSGSVDEDLRWRC